MTTDKSIPTQHLAAVSAAVGAYPDLQTVPTPDAKSIRPGQALVKLLYSGVCHSDVALALGTGTHAPTVVPLISGHEGTGIVVAVGPHTRPGDGVQVGDKVGIKLLQDGCGSCGGCLIGEEMTCGATLVSGVNVQGTFQQFLTVATSHLIPIPDGLDLAEAAPILCAGATTYNAVRKTELRPGDWLAIPGAGGGLGHLAVQYAIAMNLRVVAIDTGADKKALLEKYGVHAWIDYKETPDLVAKVKEVTGGGAKAAIITAGVIGPYQQALEYLGARGTLICIGLPHTGHMEVTPADMVVNVKRVIGSAVGNRHETKEALEFMALGKVKMEYEVLPFDQVAQTYKDLEAGKISGRVVLDLWK